MSDTASSVVEKVRVWDLPTRLFHWTLVVLIAVLWWSGENGEMGIHQWAGYGALTLVVFRVVWGFVGSTTARFATFLTGPAAIKRYLEETKAGKVGHIGHNPIGALSATAMILLVLFQGITGLFASENTFLFFEGPLADWVSTGTSESLTSWHKTSFNLLLLIIALHVASTFFYLLVKKDDLVHPMMTGMKKVSRLDLKEEAAKLHFAPLPLAGKILAGVAAVIIVISFL
ncbi:cytochrome b/b6 domain-containing protein [Roseospirillum parvum]|uniref:Cytochrome b n=1 Tax=Roseospirillum parvum TaxID=83401 RepID=A0A1G7ZBQ1_9PROT|nr:cytochrome b/b6 domain-containing protein [Roseospirillum parvum]SDH06183.1 Cytochrome b [Roseospirillum parvum]